MKWRVVLLWGLAGLLLTACGGSARPAPTCGADVCITDTRLVNPDGNSLTLIFELTEPDGSIDAAAPPTFDGTLHIRINSLNGSQQLVDKSYNMDELTCLVGDNIPGGEGRTAAACLVTLPYSEFVTQPASGEEVLLTIYGDVFPIMLSHIDIP